VHAPGAAAFAATVAVLASSTAMAIEEPGFRVLEQDGSFELREYARTSSPKHASMPASKTPADRLPALFRYISGNNVAQQKIPMTAPVTQSRGEKIAMTAPVTQVVDGRAFLVAFTLPVHLYARHCAETLDPTIRIRALPAQLVACWRYSGRWTASNYNDNEALLRERIKARGLTARGDPCSPATTRPSRPGSCVATKC